MEFGKLTEKTLSDLREIAKAMGIKKISTMRKAELITAIVHAGEKTTIEEDIEEEKDLNEEDSDQRTSFNVSGLLELHCDGYGFLRSDGFESGDQDIYVPPVQVRRFGFRTGDFVEGIAREKREGEKFSPLIYVNRVNESSVENLRNRREFESLTPIYPTEKICLEAESNEISMRIIDLISPIGKGQRGLIVSPPKAGKTSLLKSMARAIEKNHPEITVIVLLIDERPEEVTDMKRSVEGMVVASTFDEMPSNHIRVAEFTLERAKRLVEHGWDVCILTDSITRLSRAYNVTTPTSGKTLSGGLDPFALHKPKRFFGAARNIEEGGSLTIIATALVDTGSRMDDVIYEEFKGTGNMETHLSRELSELRIFPAVDIYRSGTRREELLQSKEELQAMRKIRRVLSNNSNSNIAENFLRTILQTRTNQELVNIINQKED